MSTQGSSAYRRWNLRDAQRGGMRDLDLNYPPPRENMAPTGPLRIQAQGSGHSQGQATTVADLVDDDDVVVISPRKFEEARNNARRNHSRRNGRVIEGFSEELTNWCQLGDLGAFNWELSFNFDFINKAEDTIHSVSVTPVAPQTQSVPPPEAPTFTCAICMGQLIEETSTKCRTGKAATGGCGLPTFFCNNVIWPSRAGARAREKKMEDPISSSEPLDLITIQRQVRELEEVLDQDDASELTPSESQDLLRDCGLLLQSRLEQIVSECSDVGLLEDQDYEAYLGRFEQELNSVQAESTKVSNEIEGLVRTHEEDFHRLDIDLAQLKCSLDFVAKKDLEKEKQDADVNYIKNGKDQLDQMKVNPDKFEVLELENQIEKSSKILKSLQDLECEFKWLDDTEKIEDEFTGLKVISFGENCIRLSLRTYIPKLEELVPQQKIADATEPSHVNHELLIELLEGTLDLRNAEIFPNDVYINDILDAAKSLSSCCLCYLDIVALAHVYLLYMEMKAKSSLQWFVTKVQDRIVLCTMRRLVVKNANKSRHSLQYLDKDETIVAHVVGEVDAFIKVPQGWPLLSSPLKLIYLKSSDQHSKGISLSFLCKVEELANSLGVQIRQSLSSFLDAIAKVLVEQMRIQLHAETS
ncbi:unnamed protein product [Malus baccata var. baccata]